jgi:hypothetical protein
VAPAARRFQPDIILISAGYDAHWRDPLAGAACVTAQHCCGSVAANSIGVATAAQPLDHSQVPLSSTCAGLRGLFLWQRGFRSQLAPSCFLSRAVACLLFFVFLHEALTTAGV